MAQFLFSFVSKNIFDFKENETLFETKNKVQQLIFINDSQEKHLYKNQEKRQSLLILI